MSKAVGASRTIACLPPPFLTKATPYSQQVCFSGDAAAAAAAERSAFALRFSKMVLVGDCGVGKTALVNRFCRDAFDANYKGTIGVDFEIEKFRILDLSFNLQIWDTAGQERFRCIAKSYYRDANVICVVFDMTDPATLENAHAWLSDALEANLHLSPLIFLVGTKKDLLVDDSSYKAVMRSACAAATRMKAELWATSSKEQGAVVDQLFRRVAALAFEEVMLRRRGEPVVQLGLVKIPASESLHEAKKRYSCSSLHCKQ